MSKISLICPVYNVSQYLAEAIGSVLCQEVSDWELIAVNDASTDNSLEILQAYQKRDKRIRIIDLKQNKGQGFARNLAIGKAKGDYIMFLDADDYFPKDAFTTLVDNIATKPKTEIFVWGFSSFQTGKKPKKEHLPQKPNKKRGETPFQLGMLCRKGFGATPWVYVVKRKCIEQYNIRFSEGIFFEDVEFTTKLLYHTKKVGVIPKVCYHYRNHKTSVTGRPSRKKIKQKFEAFDKIKPFLLEKKTWHRYEVIHNTRYLAYCVFTCFNEYFSLSRKERDAELDAFMLSLRKGELLSKKNLTLLRDIGLSLSKKKEPFSRKFYLAAYMGLTRIKKRYGLHRLIVRTVIQFHRLRN
jgi:glycosyltransferase involved in cell wall biosynthesis